MVRQSIKVISLMIVIAFAGLAMASGAARGKMGERFASSISIDQVWPGTNVKFAALDAGRDIYVAYYNINRLLTVAKYNKVSRKITRKVLQSVFEGWDNHRYLSLAMDTNDVLHVAGNMHASPLVYARMTRRSDLNSLRLFDGMLGSDEKNATYPLWLNLPDGRLSFFYRDGRSGDGKEYINVWSGREWQRLINVPLFVAGADRHRSAYHTRPILGDDKYFHVAWMWRGSADASTNCCVTYGKTKDFKTWIVDGDVLAAPISPGYGEVVSPLKEEQGLLDLHFSIDDGIPTVLYAAYDKNKYNQIFLSRRLDGRWKTIQVTDWVEHTDIGGKGSLSPPFSAQPAVVVDDVVGVMANHRKFGTSYFLLDRRSLDFVHDATLMDLVKKRYDSPRLKVGRSAMFKPDSDRTRYADVFTVNGEKSSFVLRWNSNLGNRDKQVYCEAPHSEKCYNSGEILQLIDSEYVK